MVDICYYSSDFYAPYTGISMYSLCKNNRDLEFRLNCIDTGISEENKAKMQQVADQFGKELVFHDYKRLEAFIRDELQLPICNGSYATYIKVFPDKIFTESDRVLFVDGDTIIDGSIRELLDTDIDDYVFAAAKVPLINEARVYEENDPNNVRLEYALKFRDSGYYNIGIFYCNLKRWGEENFGEKVLATKEAHMARMTSVEDVPIDEMMMNLAVLENPEKHYAREIPAIFNSTNHNFPHHRAKKAALLCGYIDGKEFDRAYYHPTIIHYCVFKPWFTDGYTRHKGKIRQYKKESPWPDAFEDRMYKTPTELWFGKWVHSMPTEWLMQMMIMLGHLCLRTRARVRAWWHGIREKAAARAAKREESRVLRDQNREAGAEQRAARRAAAAAREPKTHFGAALRRRWRCLKAGDWKEAFAWPGQYLGKKGRN